MNSKITVGLGAGDEGKGLTTSYLCSQTKKPIVVRFNGGHQAGHTVVHEGKRHVFSSFGSGSLQGVPTLWSHFCTFHPAYALNESRSLDAPELYVHALCPVTTPYDVHANRKRESDVRHGSVGVGFGTTIERQLRNYTLFAQDLQFESVVVEKLKNISDYYGVKWDMDEFLSDIRDFLPRFTIIHDYTILDAYNPISEGAQGILLDQDFGFFPNVTRSHTTSRNAIEIGGEGEIYYITRTYGTRHGNGFLSNENIKPVLTNNENETNKQDDWQGTFRTAILDIDMLNYALTCDRNFSSRCRKNLVITCVDQTGDSFDVTIGGKVHKISVEMLPSLLNFDFDKILYSTGASLTDMKELNCIMA